MDNVSPTLQGGALLTFYSKDAPQQALKPYTDPTAIVPPLFDSSSAYSPRISAKKKQNTIYNTLTIM